MIADVTGEMVEIAELVERLKFRQDKRRKTQIPVDVNLNVAVCWEGHTRTNNIGKSCESCRSRTEKEIIAEHTRYDGVLMDVEELDQRLKAVAKNGLGKWRWVIKKGVLVKW